VPLARLPHAHALELRESRGIFMNASHVLRILHLQEDFV
jgi:hypothetical protein